MELKAEWVDSRKFLFVVIFLEIYLSLPAGFQTAYFKAIMSSLPCISIVYSVRERKGEERGREGGRERARARQIGKGKRWPSGYGHSLLPGYAIPP